MEFTLLWAETNAQWAAWASAMVTVLLGLILFFAPTLSFRILRLRTTDAHPEAISEGRSTMAGFYLGLGLCCLLLGPQTFLYMALGASWLFTAFGRVVSMLSDRANTPYNWIALVLEILLAAAPLAIGFQFVE